MMYVRFPLSLRNVEDLLHERGIDISYETIRFWWNRFGPMFAANIRRKRIQSLRAGSNHKWQPKALKCCCVQVFNTDGTTHAMHVGNSDTYHMVTGVRELDGLVALGSIEQNSIAVFEI